MNSKTGYSSSSIRYIAYITMLIDHIGYIILGRAIYHVSTDYINIVTYLYHFTRIIGRISFPLFCLLLVEGIKKTHNKRKYLIRILVLAIISEPIFNYAVNGSILCPSLQNSIFTLFLGGVLLIILEKLNLNSTNSINYILKAMAIIASMLISHILRLDYAVVGIGIVLIISYMQNNRSYTLSNMIFKYLLLSFICEVFLNIIKAPAYLFTPGLWFTNYIEAAVSIQLLSVLSIIFVKGYNYEKRKLLPRAIYYCFYPIHLLLIRIIADILFS